MNDGDSAKCWGSAKTWIVFFTTTITAASPQTKTEFSTISPTAIVTSTIEFNVFLTTTKTEYTSSTKGQPAPEATSGELVKVNKRQEATILPTVTRYRTVTFTPILTVLATVTASLPDGVSIDPDEPSRTLTVLSTARSTVITTVINLLPPGYVDPAVKAARKRAQDRKAAIAGGVVGGLIGLGVFGGLLWWLRKRIQKKQVKRKTLKEIDDAARMSPADRMAETPWPSRNGDIVTIDEEDGVVSPSTSKYILTILSVD